MRRIAAFIPTLRVRRPLGRCATYWFGGASCLVLLCVLPLACLGSVAPVCACPLLIALLAGLRLPTVLIVLALPLCCPLRWVCACVLGVWSGFALAFAPVCVIARPGPPVLVSCWLPVPWPVSWPVIVVSRCPVPPVPMLLMVVVRFASGGFNPACLDK